MEANWGLKSASTVSIIQLIGSLSFFLFSAADQVCALYDVYLGTVVQSIVSLMTSLRRQLVKYMQST